ncbi:MAG: gliding motility-associated C-terminal domain-containing protein, partial [Saprospiraceae bacterium]
YQFRYTVPALAPCQDASATVGVVLHPVPVADAGPDYLLNCNAINATLGGTGTTANAAYEWFLGSTLVGTNITLTVDTPGTYTLMVTTVEGCSDTDVAVVESDAEVPVAQSIEKQAEACFGDNNGSITVNNIQSSHPPVLVSLNGGPFTAQTQFQSLEPGAYTIRLQDANGCEWASDTLMVAAAALLSVELGPDLELNMGDPAVVEAQLTTSVSALDTLIWSPLMDTLRAGTPLQEFLTLESRFIGIQVVDTNGCVATDRIAIIVEKPRRVYIPNVIQPNSSLNNVLQVYGGTDVASVESFMVFDRWGEKLFEATDFLPNDPSVYWSGQLNGEDLVPGVYVYYALVRFIDGEKIVYKGDVTLLR